MEVEHRLPMKNGEYIVFCTDMPDEEISKLTDVTNQYDFVRRVVGTGYWFEIRGVIKPNPVGDDE